MKKIKVFWKKMNSPPQWYMTDIVLMKKLSDLMAKYSELNKKIAVMSDDIDKRNKGINNYVND